MNRISKIEVSNINTNYETNLGKYDENNLNDKNDSLSSIKKDESEENNSNINNNSLMNMSNNTSKLKGA